MGGVGSALEKTQAPERPDTDTLGVRQQRALTENVSARAYTEPGWTTPEDGLLEGENDEQLYISAPNATGADEPAPNIELAPDLPSESDEDTDYDSPLAQAMQDKICNVVGVKVDSVGRAKWYNGGDKVYAVGDPVIVENDRGTRFGLVVIPSVRKPSPTLRKVLRHANRSDLQARQRAEERAQSVLQTARECVRARGMPIKIFRVDATGSKSKLRIYFSSEERVDYRDLVGELSRVLHARVEMRQTGVRDEAKIAGGIGSCGRELCCTTWLPEFVPVSIKMVKDQGLVLNPAKVSGQCGRLKCCLVYEQETYARLRKGLPKLGKRVVTEFGEGRIVEVDVLKQQVRVSLVQGESRTLTADQVKPMFPSQPPRKPKRDAAPK